MFRPVILFMFAGFTIGCNSANEGPMARPDLSKRPAKITCTTGMIADAAKIVGGDRVEVIALMGPGIDPHQYKASAGDLEKLQSADLIFYNGLHLEGKMVDVFDSMKKRRRTVAVTHALNPERDLRKAAEGFEGTHDPHVWFDVSLWSRVIGPIQDALIELDPAHKEEYTTRAKAYQTELAALHEEIKTKAASIDSSKRVLITAHDAFYYFGRAYGFEVHGLQGVSTASEPSTRDVQDLAKLIGTRKVGAIFGETSVPDRNVQAVRDAVVRDYGFQVKFVPGTLYSDALGDPGTPAGTYAGMVRHNIDVMVAALR